MNPVKIAVIGIGTIGAQTMHRLACRSDVEVHGFETFEPGHSSGAAGGEGRIFRRVTGSGAGWAGLAERAFRGFESLEAEVGVALRTFHGHLTLGPSDDPEMHSVLSQAKTMSAPVEVLEPAALRRLFPFQLIKDDDLGILDRDGGVIRSELVNPLTAEAAVARGAILHSGERVLSIDDDAGGVAICTTARDYRFDRVVVSVGAWARELAPTTRAIVQVHKPVSAWFALPNGDPFRPLTVFSRTRDRQYYGVPSSDGRFLKLGWAGTSQTSITDIPHEQDYFVTPAEVAPFDDLVREHFPALRRHPVRVNAYFEGYVADGRPVIQATSDRVVLAVGMSGIGFKFAPAFGEAAAALVMHEQPPTDISFLMHHL
ncbi:MAG: sarcosine oxidase [Subtercola sp.]|nr:sarcosine oxidase [Subtercola sp.]